MLILFQEERHTCVQELKQNVFGSFCFLLFFCHVKMVTNHSELPALDWKTVSSPRCPDPSPPGQ